MLTRLSDVEIEVKKSDKRHEQMLMMVEKVKFSVFIAWDSIFSLLFTFFVLGHQKHERLRVSKSDFADGEQRFEGADQGTGSREQNGRPKQVPNEDQRHSDRQLAEGDH